jgi:hypothetical protein
MRRGAAFPRFRIIAGAAVALVLALVISVSVNRYRAPAAAPPEALERIAEKNRDAAAIAAARQRAESAASTNAAENLMAAQRRGSAEADAMIERLDSEGNRSGPSGNSS